MMSDCDRERVRSRRVLTQNAVLFFHTQVAIEKLDVWLTTRRMRSRDLIHMDDGGGKLGAVEGDGRLDSSELRASLGPRIQVMSLSPLRRTFGHSFLRWRVGSACATGARALQASIVWGAARAAAPEEGARLVSVVGRGDGRFEGGSVLETSSPSSGPWRRCGRDDDGNAAPPPG